MESYSFRYGNETMDFTVPENWQTDVLRPAEPPSLLLPEALLTSLMTPVKERPFQEWLRPFKDILIIVPDVTRYAGMEHILPIIYEEYLKDYNVKIIFALGNHRKQTPLEQKNIISERLFEAVPSFDHDCYDAANLTSFGHTSTGLEVVLNTALIQTDAVIVTGSISFHYLAGYGGGRKAIFPGVSGYETILGIHRKVFNEDKPGKHSSARSGVLHGNPMHEEIMQGISLIKTPMFLINTVLDDNHSLLNVFCGNLKESHERGCEWFMEHFGCTPQEKADIAIVSAGGFPKDINFIQAHKAIEHAMGAVREKGTVIVLGKCEDGLGNSDFLKWFNYPTLDEMERDVRKADKVYAQTAYATRLKAERCRIILVSELDEQTVRTMGLVPARSIDEAIALADNGSRQICHLIPIGSSTLVCD
jgi:nickel-dependent lactate racemase